jgi:hypothetical protein
MFTANTEGVEWLREREEEEGAFSYIAPANGNRFLARLGLSPLSGVFDLA